MYEELKILLSTELLRLSQKERLHLSLLILLVIPSIRVSLFKNLSSRSIKYLFLVPAGQVFAVEFLVRSPRICINHFLVACLVETKVILTVTCLNYIIFHRPLLREYRKQWDELAWYKLAWECSFPVNVVQQVGTNLAMVLICRQLGYPGLSITRTILFGIISIWTERVCIQLVWYDGYRPERHPYRVFYTHWGPSADTGHWFLQLEESLYHIKKQNGSFTADLKSVEMSEEKEVPSLQKSLYIPFCQYGIVGLSDKYTLMRWEGFVRECIEHYNLANRSCQEYVIFIMYYLCYPPLFNMSDTKSLGPIILVVLPFYIPFLYKLL